MSRSYYDILHVKPDATPDEIKDAYRTLAWQIQSEGGQEGLKEFNAAYSVLSNLERRAEYDRSLPSASERPAPLRIERPAMLQGAARSPVSEEGPGFHPFLRLLGVCCDISYDISRIKYYFIPFSLILGLLAIVGTVTCAINYVDAPAKMVPHKTTVGAVIRDTDKGQFITVYGRVNRKLSYVQTQDSIVTHYYALIDGNDILYMKGESLPDTGTFTGKLTSFSSGMKKLVTDDARDPDVPKGIRIETTSYLDIGYTPTPRLTYLFGLIFSALGALVLLIPPLLRYSIFSRRTGRVSDQAAEPPSWPISVLATGQFVVTFSARKRFESRMPAILIRTGNPDFPLQVYADSNTKHGIVTRLIAIPADSTVAWGYEYGGGKPRPSLSFGGRGASTRVSVPTAADAQWIVEMFTSGSIKEAVM